ncbi:MAG: O-antigen ligase family protein [Actinomycetota bacterium]|nr:O-antigen ligase family protein [Actinomycetota bacterium]
MYAALDELRLRPVTGAVLLGAVAAWTIWFAMPVIGGPPLPGTSALLISVPVVIVLLLLLEDRPDPLLRLCASWLALLAVAFVFAFAVAVSPPLALAPMALVLSAIVCNRYPAGTAIGLFALTGFYGSLVAFTGLSGAGLVDLLLGGMWTGMLLSRVRGGRTKIGIVWPATLVLGLYIAISGITIFTGDTASGILSFRLSTWYLLAAILVAYAGWSHLTYTKIARGVVVTGLLVGGYATFRWIVGPATTEQEFAATVGGAFNYVDGELRTFGSFGSGHQLGFWSGAMAPFCLAAAIGWDGRWRKVAAAAFVALVFANLASEVRGGFIGLVLGSGVVLILAQLAPSMPRLDVGRKALIAIACVATVAVPLMFVSGATDRIERYTNILSPSEDVAYNRRDQKWDLAVPEINREPLGHGLGSASLNPALRPPYVSIAAYSLDNSYLRIAYEQGFPVLILLVVGLGMVLLRLTSGSLKSKARVASAMGTGAAGTLASLMIIFYTGMYNEDVLVLGAWFVVGVGAAFLLREEAGIERAAERTTAHGANPATPGRQTSPLPGGTPDAPVPHLLPTT